MTDDASELRIAVRRRSDALVIALVGVIDTYTTAKLQAALIGALVDASGPLVIDLSDVSFLGTSGIAVLLGANTEAVKQRRPFEVVTAAGQPAHRMIEILGLKGVLRVSTSPDAD